MKSKTTIEKQTKRKRNPKLVETLIAAKKNNSWLKIASLLSYPSKKRINLNLNEINKKIKNSKKVLIPGKVLSQGKIDTPKGTSKKIKVIALNFSEKAKEKLLNSGCEVLNILDEIKLNPSAKDIKILKK